MNENDVKYLLDRTDILYLVSQHVDFVSFKGEGPDTVWTSNCPFHNENSQSFCVSYRSQSYHCFGCGANGNAISFVMKYCEKTFPEAVEYICEVNDMVAQLKGGGRHGITSKIKESKEMSSFVPDTLGAIDDDLKVIVRKIEAMTAELEALRVVYIDKTVGWDIPNMRSESPLPVGKFIPRGGK